MGRQQENNAEVPPPPSSRVPCYIVVQKSSKKSAGDSYNTSASKLLGYIHFFCGAVAFFSGSCLLVNLDESSYWRWPVRFDEAGAGIWCGFMFFLGGILNNVTAKYKRNRLIISNLVFGIVTTMFAIALVTIASLAILVASREQERLNSRYNTSKQDDNEYRKSIGFNVVLLVTGLVEIVLGIFSSSLSCKATCCRESDNTTSMRSEVMFTQTGELDQEQIISLANQMQERRNVEVEEGSVQPPRYHDAMLPSSPI